MRVCTRTSESVLKDAVKSNRIENISEGNQEIPPLSPRRRRATSTSSGSGSKQSTHAPPLPSRGAPRDTPKSFPAKSISGRAARPCAAGYPSSRSWL